MIYFYINNENSNGFINEHFYWTGKGFSENEEQAMLYTIKKSREFLEENKARIPVVKDILKQCTDLTLNDIKIG